MIQKIDRIIIDVLQENLINPIIVILMEICVHIEYNKLYIKYFFFY